MGLKASEQKAVGGPIVLATKPDPLAHMNTHAHTLTHNTHCGSFKSLTSAGKNAEGRGGVREERGLIGIRRRYVVGG